MSKLIDIGVEKDHIESLTKANGITALSELIWNCLDADATEVNIEYKPTKLGGYEYIKIQDNGHGLTYEKAQEVFSRLGGSDKKTRTQSPTGRQYHGKEGKGRYKGLSLGDLVKFTSVYASNGSYSTFTATIDRNKISSTELSDLKTIKKNEGKSGFTVEIDNVNSKEADHAFSLTNRRDFEEKFASYWISYPLFKIYFNGNELKFDSLIKKSDEIKVESTIGELTYKFIIKVIEWNFENRKKTYLCNSKGIPFTETSLGIRTGLNISVFIQSVYIEKLQRESLLEFYESNEVLMPVLKQAKEFARDYCRKQLHEHSKEFIFNLKTKGLYPYKEPADNIFEETKRQVFDIVALNINEYLPSFNDQDDKNKKLTLALVSEALENDPQNLRRILTELVELPEDKRDELADLLEKTSLSNIIDTMTEIGHRLQFINGLEEIIYNAEVNKGILERKHLHKILVQETWIFGDQYTYGADDNSLKNVLKDYLKHIGRDDFEEVVESNPEMNESLNIIPDVCLWRQFPQGKPGHKTNLIIELKKPTVDAGPEELTQIKTYAARVSKDSRFPKDKTKWKFLLVTRNIKPDIEPELEQTDRDYGHVVSTAHYDVHVLTWGHILTEAKARYEFIKEKLNFSLSNDISSLEYLKSKYKEYLPSDLEK